MPFVCTGCMLGLGIGGEPESSRLKVASQIVLCTAAANFAATAWAEKWNSPC